MPQTDPSGDEPLPPEVLSAPIRTARDEIDYAWPNGFVQLYEVQSYRNAAEILASTCTDEFDQLIETLASFRISTEDMLASGGNKSKIAIAMESALWPYDWHETRITAQLIVTKHVDRRQKYRVEKGKESGKIKSKLLSRERHHHRIPGFVDGHKVDFVKGQVAFDMEWNSKDQTFDRDLYAVRALYECNIISAAVLLTRSKELVDVFKEIQARLDSTDRDFTQKYGASTTWMGKLEKRLKAGRAGGCPVLALGIRTPVIHDFEAWKAVNPIKRQPTFTVEDATDVDEEY